VVVKIGVGERGPLFDNGGGGRYVLLTGVVGQDAALFRETGP